MQKSRIGFFGYRTRLSMLLLIVLVVPLLAACGGSDDKESKSEQYTVGILCHSQSIASTVDGFKAGMAELGYVEGENITYIYNGPTGSIDALKPALEDLMSKKIDLLLTTGTPPTSAAKETLQGKDIPVVFAPVNDPVADGFVESMTSPGGFITGIKNSNSVGKSLQWLVQIMPDVKRVYVPHNPNDQSSVHSVEDLQSAAGALGIELVVAEADTAEKVTALAADLPDDVDAVFIGRSGLVSAKLPEFVQTANERGIPVFVSTSGEFVEAGAMLGYGSSYYSSGKQAAHLADQILHGASPANVPAEEAEALLAINLHTAAVIGVDIPDAELRQASEVYRE